MTRWELTSKYGTANVTGAGYLVKIKLPYPMRIAWDLDSTVNTMMCHKLVADKFTAVFNELLATYGYDKIKELGIDLWQSMKLLFARAKDIKEELNKLK